MSSTRRTETPARYISISCLFEILIDELFERVPAVLYDLDRPRPSFRVKGGKSRAISSGGFR
jgi:hypothetical protein